MLVLMMAPNLPLAVIQTLDSRVVPKQKTGIRRLRWVSSELDKDVLS